MTLEADSGQGSVPMIHLTSAFHAIICDWTKQMNGEACLALEMWYYNDRFMIWEPLLEPVGEDGASKHPWQLEAYVSLLNVLCINLVSLRDV